MSGRTSLKNILLWSRWLGVNPSSVDTDPTRVTEHILFSNSETSLSAGFVTTFKTVILVKLSVATVNSTDTVSHRFRTSEHPGPVHPGVCLKTHTDMAFSILEQKRTKPGISWIQQYKSITTTLFIEVKYDQAKIDIYLRIFQWGYCRFLDWKDWNKNIK